MDSRKRLSSAWLLATFCRSLPVFAIAGQFEFFRGERSLILQDSLHEAQEGTCFLTGLLMSHLEVQELTKFLGPPFDGT